MKCINMFSSKIFCGSLAPGRPSCGSS
uniref:Uncharacterized protein n=1 Tax=Anopheles coluzzii TaxID=1518534 RepID=A0A6E8WA80_ANOCL